jgi:hypothetical protein
MAELVLTSLPCGIRVKMLTYAKKAARVVATYGNLPNDK